MFGAMCGAVVIAIVARYGFRTADNQLDGFIWAFMYGMIAFGGLFGHALSARLWREHRRVAVMVGIGAALALTVNLSNSLGAMAGRSNEKQAGRIKVADMVRDARRDLKRAQEEREAMRFIPTDEASVISARTAGAVATISREAECSVRGRFCRHREEDERKSLEALQGATAGKAATDRAAALDGEITRLKSQILSAGPVLDANPQGSAFARLFDLPDSAADWLTTWQSFAMAVIAELLIVLSMVAAEVLRKPFGNGCQTKRQPEPVALEPIAERVEPPKAIPAPAKPRLAASRATPADNVAIIMAELLEPGEGRVELAEAGRAYARACRTRGQRPVSPESFSLSMKRYCRNARVKIECQGEHIYFVGLRLKLNSNVNIMSIDQYML